MKNETKKRERLKSVVIRQDLIQCHCDYNEKAFLAYIQFRGNLKGWTFSQADMVKTLRLDKSMVSRLVKSLVTKQVLRFEGILNTANKGKFETKLYSVNSDNLKRHILSLQSPSHGENVPSHSESAHSQGESVPSHSENTRSQGENYKNDITRKMEKKDGKEGLQEPEIISFIQSQPLPRVAPLKKTGDDMVAEFDRIWESLTIQSSARG